MVNLRELVKRMGCCASSVTKENSLESELPSHRPRGGESSGQELNVRPRGLQAHRAAAASSRIVTLTIPPTPDGPLEEAERRMKESPKFRKGQAVRDKYTLGRVLGAGGFAVVKMATDKVTGKKYACKVIRLPKSDNVPKDEVTRSEVFQEVEIATCANHRNIISVKEFFVSEKRVAMIMDYMEGGMALDSLLDRKNGRYTEDDAKGVMKQILEGLAYLHERNVAHRDLKLENILLARKNDLSHIKIVDFGLSKHTTGMMSSVLGTPQFVSPEMLNRKVKTYGKYVDMWSAGVLLYIFLSGFPPFFDTNENALFKKIIAGNYSFNDPVWNSVSESGKDLISKLLVKDTDVRLSAAEALQHEWFASDEEHNEPLQETQSNLLRLRRAKLLQKAGRVVIALNRMRLTPTEDNIQDMAMQLNMDDMNIPEFLLDESEEDDNHCSH